MIPFGNETITLYHRSRTTVEGRARDVWERIVIHGCSLVWKEQTQFAEGLLRRGVQVTCRIPPDGQAPAVGDVIVPGEIADEADSSMTAARLIESHAGAFRVSSVAFNNRPGFPMPHYAARSD